MNSFSEHARSIICYVSIITLYNIAMHIMPYIYATNLSSKVQYFIWSFNDIFVVGSGQE